jgi:hypothetical protein
LGLSAYLVCVGLAALTLLVPSAPSTDPWGWILWGREVANFELSTELRSAPAWKPLPVLLTTPLSLAGDAAPTLWILLVRSLGLAGLLLAFLLSGRLVGDGPAWLRAAAGLVAVSGLLVTRGLVRQFSHGYSEPLALALLFAAIQRHLSGRRTQALLLGAAVAATRPEAIALVAAYGALLVWRSEARLATVAATVVALPAVWLVPDWIGSGDPFLASTLAAKVLDQQATLTFGFQILPLPLVLASIAGAALALRGRERAFLEVAGLAFAWYAVLRLMIAFGYPTSWRFFELPAGILCVVGAAGLVRLVTLPRTGWIRAPLAAAAVAVLVVSIAPRAERSVAAAENSATRAQVEWDLWHAVTRAGGADLSGCGSVAFPRGFRWTKGVVGWRLAVPFRKLGKVRSPGSLGVARVLASGAARRIKPGMGPRGAGRAVIVVVPPEPVVMFLPFAGMRIKLAPKRDRPRIERLGSYGQWLVATSDPARCRAKLGRKGE